MRLSPKNRLIICIIVLLLWTICYLYFQKKSLPHFPKKGDRPHTEEAIPRENLERPPQTPSKKASEKATERPRTSSVFSLSDAQNQMNGAEMLDISIVAPNEALYQKTLALLGKFKLNYRLLPQLRAFSLKGSRRDISHLLEEAGWEEELPFDSNEPVIMLPSFDECRPSSIAENRPFLDKTLAWLGMNASEEDRGKSVKIAILDTAVNTQTACLKEAQIKTADPFSLSSEGDAQDHGTAVASIIAGSGEVTGIAPSAELLAFTVLDGNGFGTTYHLAEAIVTAADQGATIISMSLGFESNSSVLKSAVEYAQGKGAVIVASAGNEGTSVQGNSTVLYPGAYKGVVCVGAVDANGDLATFSSTGEEVTLTAPGVGLLAQGNKELELFSGTSASAPVVAASIAYVMDRKNCSAEEAVHWITENCRDAGEEGADSLYGEGILNLRQGKIE